MVQLEQIRNKCVHSFYVDLDELRFLEELHGWLILKEIRNKYQN